MKIAFVVRSLARQIPTYTTTHLAWQSHLLGHEVSYTTVDGISYCDGHGVWAKAHCLPPDRYGTKEAFLQAIQDGPREEQRLSDFDLVFFRYNPAEFLEPGMNRAMMEFGGLLKADGVRVVNDPLGLSVASSKMYLAGFPEAIRARTLFTRSPSKVKRFLTLLGGPAIIKPPAGYGGTDVFLIRDPEDVNINQIISAVSRSGYVLVQEYLAAASLGDKRLLMVNGEPVFDGDQPAIYLRKPRKGEVRANIHAGGRPEACEFTETDRRIAECIGPRLRADGLSLVGVDIVGDKLLEINVFCAGGVNNMNGLYNTNMGRRIIEALTVHQSLESNEKPAPHLRRPVRGTRDLTDLR